MEQRPSSYHLDNSQSFIPEQQVRVGYAVEEVRLAKIRGTCGGVNMALETAEQVLQIVAGREAVYSNWDIVNNTPIVSEFEEKGLKSVRNNWEVVPNDAIVLFSAHGVPPQFYDIARERNFFVIDATCPLVTKVHIVAKKAEKEGMHIGYLGVDGHPETEGVRGELSPENVTLLTKDKTIGPDLPKDKPIILLTQTTLSTTDVKRREEETLRDYPNATVYPRGTICYAADNRQHAVREMIQGLDSLIIVGSKHSHNSNEMRNIGDEYEVPSYLIDTPQEIKNDWFTPAIKIVGVSSGASVLERYTQPVLDWFAQKGTPIVPVGGDEREMTFKLPLETINALKQRFA